MKLNKTSQNKIIYSDDWGGATQLIEVYVDVSQCKTQMERLRTLQLGIYREIEDSTLPSHTGCGYDCTGQAFGSNFQRIFWQCDQYDNTAVALLIHKFSIDI